MQLSRRGTEEPMKGADSQAHPRSSPEHGAYAICSLLLPSFLTLPTSGSLAQRCSSVCFSLGCYSLSTLFLNKVRSESSYVMLGERIDHLKSGFSVYGISQHPGAR